MLIGSIGTQAAAVLVTDMLPTVGAPGVSGLRMAAAAVIMVLLFRPRLSGMTRARVINIVVYGVAIGLMNVMLYQAIARLPQGVAVTIDFLGPCVVSFLGLKMWRSRLWAIAAFVLAPFAVSAAPHVHGSMWGTIVLSGFIGAVVPFVMDTIAAGIVSAAVVGTLFALDPVIGAILGWAFSGDQITCSMAAGIALIAVAGAIITWRGAKESRVA